MLPLAQVQLGDFIFMEHCFHLKGYLENHNYSDVNLSYKFSESKFSKSVTSKRKNDSIFFISDISQVKTILLKTHIHSNELCPSEYSQNFCMDYFYFLLFSIFFFSGKIGVDTIECNFW